MQCIFFSYSKSINNLEILVSPSNSLSSLFLTSLFNFSISFIADNPNSLSFSKFLKLSHLSIKVVNLHLNCYVEIFHHLAYLAFFLYYFLVRLFLVLVIILVFFISFNMFFKLVKFILKFFNYYIFFECVKKDVFLAFLSSGFLKSLKKEDIKLEKTVFVDSISI